MNHTTTNSMKKNVVFAMMMMTMTMMMLFISTAEANTRKLKARERMRQDREERERKLAGGDDSGLVFSRGYICIIKPTDFTFAIPRALSGDDGPGFSFIDLLGSSTFQSGGIYDPADVKVVDRIGTTQADNFEAFASFDNSLGSSSPKIFEKGGIFEDSEGFLRGEDIQQIAGPFTDEPTNVLNETFNQFFPQRFQFAGQRQPLFVPQADPGYFLNGECVATSVVGTMITGHSCLLNLCLGGGGYNCLAIYAGSKFVFDPLAVVLVGNENSGIVKESTIETKTVNNTNAGFDFFDPEGVNQTQAEFKPNANRIVPALPPSYPGTIIGGTGFFVGAVGYVDVTTITGSTLPPVQAFAGSNTDEFISARNSQVGYITQKINVVTNRPLPAAP